MDAVLGWNLVLSLPVILAIAWLAGRLLGVSRSWAATVVAGAAGWLAALALSLAIASGDTGAPGFTRNLWVFADAEDVRTVARLLNRVVLAGLGGLVGVLSVMLLGTQGGPPFTGDTSLFQFFGYFGLFCSTVLILRMIVANLRDGLN
jgi:hypothetical protein